MKKIKKKLERATKAKKSNWGDEAAFRMKNHKWLRYSSNIARRILASIEDRKALNQKILAERIGVKPQYINKVVKGQENLSLETIAKLSDALGYELIRFPVYKYNRAIKKLSVQVGYFENAYISNNPMGSGKSLSLKHSSTSMQSIAILKSA